MSTKKSWSWIPAGVMAALLLSLAVAWAFRDRGAQRAYCADLYAAAATATDSVAVDATPVPMGRADNPVTCAEVMGR